MVYGHVIGWLDLIKYYVAAYKTGTYPAITKDRVYLWARLYPANATAPDPVGRPANYQWVRRTRPSYRSPSAAER